MPQWNWQHPDWPTWRLRKGSLVQAERLFAEGCGRLLTTLERSGPGASERIMVERVVDEAMTTSTIEGEALDRASVQSSVRRALSFGVPDRSASLAERGIAELLIDVCRSFPLPLEVATLHRWHAMVMSGRTDLADVGRWRTRSEPMQVVSGRLDRPTVHFEAPPSKRVPGEMRQFIDWFNTSAAACGRARLGPLARAGIAHLWFESIHPYADGNGRIGRAIAEKALAQSMEHPSLTALSPVILARRSDYYRALAAASTTLDIDAWQRWFAGAALQAQARALAEIEFITAKARLLASVGMQLNVRQEKALLRMMSEGSQGFEGGMTASKYMAITRASPATATRALGGLAEAGALVPHGARRHMRYELSLPTRTVPTFEVREDGSVHSTPLTRARSPRRGSRGRRD